MSMIALDHKCCGRLSAVGLALCATLVFALSATADSAADAVMFRKPKPVPLPAQSFLVDVAPVKEVKEEKPAPPKVAEPVKKPVAPKPGDTPKVEKTENSAPAVAPVIPVEKKAAEAVKVEEKMTEDTSKVEEKKTEEVAATDQKKEAKKKKKEKSDKPARDALITADRTDYDRKEGVVLFDRNVHVDDAQYQMHADRLFLFLEGTNDLKRLVAIGHVAITNEDKRAYCARATFNKKLGRVVMYSSDEITAELREEGKKGSDVKGEKITFWLDSEQVEVENPVITMPGGLGGQGNMKKLIGK